MDLLERIGQGGEIHVFPEDTASALYYPSNNDASVKAIAARLVGARDRVIDGHGAKLIFHGRISPFVLDGCENITLRNFSVDYHRPFYTEGVIVEGSRERVVLDIAPEFPYRVTDNGIEFVGDGWETDLSHDIVMFQEFDGRKRAPAYNSPVLLVNIGDTVYPTPEAPLKMLQFRARELAPGRIELTGDFHSEPKVGNVLVIIHESRQNSAIFVTGCKNVNIENVTITHAGSMGVIAQATENIALRHVKMLPGAGRIVSVNCDATHFVNCTGKVIIEDCEFANMLDDGANIHGIYTTVESVADKSALLRFNHFQQQGAPIYYAGDKLVFTRGHTREIAGEAVISRAEHVDPKHVRVSFDESVSFVSEGDICENRYRMPEAEIRRTRVYNNRPRAFLVSTPRRAVIEDCWMSNCSYGVHVTGDSNYWFESGGITDLVIRRNRFVNCNYQGGDFAIGITPEYEPTEKAPCFHRNIRIEDNDFELFTDGLVEARGVDGLTVTNNRYRHTDDYPKRRDTGFFEITGYCLNTKLDPPEPLA